MVDAKKSFGQHFLRDAATIQRILEAARPEEFALTVEVGPGQGALTDVLAPAARRLLLIEADRDLIPTLQTRYSNAEVVRGDAARVPLPAPGEPWLLVGNLPYNAANAIIMHALESSQPPERMVVMVQKEVGERLLGLPGSRGLLTVAVQMYADVARVCTVKPGAFVPPPAVDSMVVSLSRKTPPAEAKRIIAVAKAGFSSRRKQLHGNLAEAGIAASATTKRVLETMGLPPTARAEELSIAQWVMLVEHLA